MAQRPGLPKHRIDQGRLTVVDVRDDGDVAEFVLGFHWDRDFTGTGISLVLGFHWFWDFGLVTIAIVAVRVPVRENA
jgi:hypothetical protein